MGVVRKEDGSLHFFVNGVAQGPAAWNVPPSVYAVVDLYGQAAQATIMDDMGEKMAPCLHVGSTLPQTLMAVLPQWTSPLYRRTAQTAPPSCPRGVLVP